MWGEGRGGEITIGVDGVCAIDNVVRDERDLIKEIRERKEQYRSQ